jgi:hypothetical protein
MDEATLLKAWMESKGYSHRTLGVELGYGYDFIYKIVGRKDRKLSSNFKFRFIQRFGWDEAGKVFDASSLIAPVAAVAQ